MYTLGICESTDAIYEGTASCYGYRLMPPPMLVPIRFAGAETSRSNTEVGGKAPDIFREDDFDAVTRVRRGRVYSARNQGHQPREWHISDPFPNDLSGDGFSHDRTHASRLLTYNRDSLNDLVSSKAAKLPTVILGTEPYVSFWRIVALEASHGGVILTLKAVHSLGELPELIPERVPERCRRRLQEVLEAVETSINHLESTSIIDRCRDALSIVFGELCGDPTLDLAKAIEGYESANSRGDLCSWCGKVVARLHSKAKPNEQSKHSLMPPAIEHSQLALKCLWVVLVERGWAR